MKSLRSPAYKKRNNGLAYLFTFLHSLLGEDLKKWVDERIEIRNKQISIRKNENIEMDPDIAHIFIHATHISCKNINLIDDIQELDFKYI